MNIFASKHSLTYLFPLILSLTACGGGDSSSDQAPIAKLTILGTAQSGEQYIARSGADVLVSGKDSDGVDDPILTYDFRVLSPSDMNDRLVERTRNTKLFKTPIVQQDTEIEFELTIADSDQVTRTTTATLQVKAANDADVFLTQKAVTDPQHNTYQLAVALDLSSGEVSAGSYTVLVENIAEWLPAFPNPACQYGESQDRCRLKMDEQLISGQWQSGLSYEQVQAEVAANAYFNPRHQTRIPYINVDDINQHFDQGPACINDELRCQRLELDRIDDARMLQRFSFVDAGSPARLILLQQDGEQFIDSGLLWLSTRSSEDAQEVDVDLIRRSENIESFASASAYYRLIDPENRATTLRDWLNLRGFVPGVENESAFAHATYVNNYDLGFGRDMYMRKDECGNVYSYVDNYPSLELALQGRNGFATVVMEYSAMDTSLACSEQDDKFVKFYSYVPSDFTGEMVRVASMNFDGRGEKFVPGVCTVCHGGSPYTANDMLSGADNVVEFVGGLGDEEDVYTAIDALSDAKKRQLAELNASFMPFDLDAYLYTEGPLADPFLNPDLLRGTDVSAYSLANQADDFRQFNKNTLYTYLHAKTQEAPRTEVEAGDEASRWDAPITLINAWYGTSIESLEELNTIDGHNFDAQAVMPGWESESELYHDVYAKYCRACHTQVSNTALNFATAQEFFGTEQAGMPGNIATLAEKVLNQGQMPIARLTYDRFWADFTGNSAAGSQLTERLQSYDPSIASAPLIPALDFTVLVADGENGNASNLDNSVNGPGQWVSLETALSESQLPSWDLSNDCGSETFLHADNTASAGFFTDMSPCAYRISLALPEREPTVKTLLVDRKPVAKALSYTTNKGANDTAESAVGYQPGDSTLVLDLLANPDFTTADFGDGEVSVVVNNSSTPYELAINPSVSLNDRGQLELSLTDRLPTSEQTLSFEYQLQDLSPNDTSSIAESKGQVDVSVAGIALPLSTDALTDTSVSFSWASNPSGLRPDTVLVYRATGDQASELLAAISAGSATPIATLENCHITADLCDGNVSAWSYTDNTVVAGAEYTYVVQAALNAEPGKDNAATLLSSAITEAIAVKPVLNLSSDAGNPDQLNLNWSEPSGLELGQYTLLRCDRSANSSCVPDEVVLSSDCSSSSRCTSGASNNWQLSDSGLTPNNRYAYQLSVVNELSSANSTTVSAATFPAAPTGLSVSNPSNSSVTLDWSDNSNNPSGLSYRITEVSDPDNCFSGPVTVNAPTTARVQSLACPDYVTLRIQSRGLDNQNSATVNFSSTRRLVTTNDLNTLANSYSTDNLGYSAQVCDSCHTVADVVSTRTAQFESENCTIGNNYVITGCTGALSILMNDQPITNNAYTRYMKRWLEGN